MVLLFSFTTSDALSISLRVQNEWKVVERVKIKKKKKPREFVVTIICINDFIRYFELI